MAGTRAGWRAGRLSICTDSNDILDDHIQIVHDLDNINNIFDNNYQFSFSKNTFWKSKFHHKQVIFLQTMEGNETMNSVNSENNFESVKCRTRKT